MIVACEIFGEADEVGAEEAADHADHVNGGYAGGCGSSLKEASGQRPEGPLHGVVGDDDGADGEDDVDGIGRETAGEEAGRDEQGPGDDVHVAGIVGVWGSALDAVGVGGVDQHGGCAEEAKCGDDEADLRRAEMGCALDEVGSDKGVGVGGGQHEQVEEADLPDAWIEDGGAEIVAALGNRRGGERGIVVDVVDDPGALVFGEPLGLLGAVGEQVEEGDAEEDRWDAFDEEEPLPAAEAEVSVEVEECAGDEAHEDEAERQGDEEAADGAGAEVGWEPMREVEDDAGKEAGFGDAEEEARGVELPGGADEEHGHGEDSPGDHDAGEPAAGSEAVEEQVRGNLAGGVAEEEEAGAEAVDGGAEVEVAVHLEPGEADVDAVHVGCAVAEGDEGDEALGGFAHGGCADGCADGGRVIEDQG